MKVTLLVLAVVVASLVAASTAAARAACTPGRTTGGRTYCGPATATLKVGGKTYHFRQGGICRIAGSTLSLNIGTFSLTRKATKTYFGILSFGRKPGKHDAAVTWWFPRKRAVSLNNAKVTLARGLKGTFAGKVPGGGKASGSFTCR